MSAGTGSWSTRRATTEDLEALAGFVRRAVERGDVAGSSDPHGTFTLDVVRYAPSETAVVVDGGAIVGFMQPEIKELIVDPAVRRRGIGRALVEAGIEIERGRKRPHLLLGIVSGDTGGVAFLTATWFALHSLLWDLHLPATTSVESPAWPEGITARAFDRTRDVEAFAAIFNEAFEDHPTPMLVTPGMVRATLDDPRVVDADMLVLEAADGGLVGFCQTNPKRPELGMTEAEVAMIGVSRARRGEGLGGGLLAWGVGYLRGLGADEVTLSVNGLNPHALGLYERRGFVRVSTRERWARSVGIA